MPKVQLLVPALIEIVVAADTVVLDLSLGEPITVGRADREHRQLGTSVAEDAQRKHRQVEGINERELPLLVTAL